MSTHLQAFMVWLEALRVKFVALVVAVWRNFMAFLGPVAGSLYGYINLEEVSRIVITAVASGASTPVILHLLWANLATVFTPGTAAVIGFLVTMIFDGSRRLGHGPTIAMPVNAPQVVVPEATPITTVVKTQFDDHI